MKVHTMLMILYTVYIGSDWSPVGGSSDVFLCLWILCMHTWYAQHSAMYTLSLSDTHKQDNRMCVSHHILNVQISLSTHVNA